MNSYDGLHDATLVNVEIVWSTGELRACFNKCDRHQSVVCLVASGITDLKCTRTLPWGMSVSVNSVSVASDNNVKKLTIQMQSGDIIEAIVEDCVLTD